LSGSTREVIPSTPPALGEEEKIDTAVGASPSGIVAQRPEIDDPAAIDSDASTPSTDDVTAGHQAPRSSDISTSVADEAKPRVLYLSFFFPPSRASGVFRGLATANHLARSDWDVTVITAPREFFSYYLSDATDDTLEAAIEPSIRVERPHMSNYHWERDVHRFGFARRNVPFLVDRLYKSGLKYVFPEHYLTWVPGLIKQAVKMHSRKRFDLIVATGNPFVSFAAAWALHRILGLPYMVDYRDAWTFNQFSEEVRYPEGHRVRRWEARVLREATEIVFVNDGLRKWHAAHYPFAASKMTVVPNGWEPEILGRQPYRAPQPDQPLRFAYAGTVTPQLPIEVLFDAWRLARKNELLADATLDVHGHLGFFPHQAEVLRERLPLTENIGVSYRGAFGKLDAARIYEQTDVLLFCVPGARYVTSGKVFEYMATGKPIVSVHKPDIAATEVLRDYPLWFSGGSLDAETVAESMIAAARAARGLDAPQHDAAVSHAYAYTREATLSPWEARMRQVVKARRR
jgi:glycosyltransferase involved in cell wall biosynthesis